MSTEETNKIIDKKTETKIVDVREVNNNQKDRKNSGQFKKTFQKNRRFGARRGGRPERVRSEFDHRILSVRRVARVTSGGKRFSLSLAVAVGNRKGKIGIGTGKGLDTAIALEKALRRARKNAVLIKTNKNMSIYHGALSKYSSAQVMVRPAPNRGMIAGSAIRIILELGGLKDINAKILSGSKNKLNIAKATLKALTSLKTSETKQIKEVKEKSNAKT